jgi:lipopolysaccharide/colanic/teichoic acid biosynthesis glycosyltransferase
MPESPPRIDRRKNRVSPVFGPPYTYFDRRAARTPLPGWRLKLRRSRLWRAVAGEVPPVKRMIDVLGAVTLLTVLSPVVLLIAVAIKCGGLVLAWQTRVGRGGRCFDFPTFRTTAPGPDGPRPTRVGRLLRAAGLDGLPQLWCVLAGHMSLVGPRPAPPTEVDRYAPRDVRRLEVAPGLTCWWLVEGRDPSFARQVELDLRYVDRPTLWADVVVLARTVPALWTGFCSRSL